MRPQQFAKVDLSRTDAAMCDNKAMATRSVKFEISLEKLTVKFEGDIHVAEQLHGQITGAINNLASAQSRLLAPPSPSQPVAVASDSSARRRKRKRRTNDTIDVSVLDAEQADGVDSGDGDGSTGDVARRRTGSAPTALITILKDEGFFVTKRTLGSVREALAAKGHTLKSGDVTPVLISLTREGVLKRDKNPQKQWIYFA
jgi:hypothetical protein